MVIYFNKTCNVYHEERYYQCWKNISSLEDSQLLTNSGKIVFKNVESLIKLLLFQDISPSLLFSDSFVHYCRCIYYLMNIFKKFMQDIELYSLLCFKSKIILNNFSDYSLTFPVSAFNSLPSLSSRIFFITMQKSASVSVSYSCHCYMVTLNTKV